MKTRLLPRGFTLVELLVVMAILAVLAGLLMSAVQKVRSASLKTRCLNNLRQIGLALHQYHEVYNSLPPGLRGAENREPYPFMSWNTRILPFLDQATAWVHAQAAYAQTPMFWQVPPHLLDILMPVFGCPADSRTLEIGNDRIRSVAFTSYLGVEGTNQFRHDGVLYLNSQVRFGDVTDGLSNTLLVGERPPSADQRLGWWYAGWGQNQDGSADMVLGVRELNLWDGASKCPRGPYAFGPGRPDDLCDAFHYWSSHPGGAHFLFADGSGHFLSYSAASVLPALATRNGGETGG